LGSRGACQRRTVFLYEAVKEQRYAVSRSHEETRKAREKQPPKKTQKKKKQTLELRKNHPHKNKKEQQRERKKEGNEGRKEACATMDLDLAVDDPR